MRLVPCRCRAACSDLTPPIVTINLREKGVQNRVSKDRAAEMDLLPTLGGAGAVVGAPREGEALPLGAEAKGTGSL